ncbi:MAG: alpha/beta hydrolase [Spirochaetota bacterium]
MKREAVTSWEVSSWEGLPRYDGIVNGRKTTIIVPENSDTRWAWRPEFFGAFANADVELCRRGVTLAYIDIVDHYGSPKGLARGDELYRFMTNDLGMSKTPALIALSRAGLTAYRWAALYPDRVSCIYADAPVCDIKSWPGGKGTGPGSPNDWQKCLAVYGFTESDALSFRENPIDILEKIVAAEIPLLHVAGDADEVVPFEENTKLLVERVRTLGGSIDLIVKPGVKHHPHGLTDPRPIVDFILKHCRAA